MYEYKVIAGDIKLPSGKTISNVLEETFKELEDKGWELYQIGEVREVIPPGCLSVFLFHAENQYKFHPVYVFRKPKTSSK